MSEKILIVDDEESIRVTFEYAAEEAGYTPFTAENGQEALKILENTKISIMFFDLHMPGMNGLELCRKIRSNHPIELIYAMTGYSSLFDLAACREAGFDDYFLKPLSIDLFLKTVRDSEDKLNRWKKKK
ncbi:MAG TPA: response regulator [Candidatus Marinimicrobia bacterium]|nr:response regulator [Candidatus Neomarinimicrobiota bacterium]